MLGYVMHDPTCERYIYTMRLRMSGHLADQESGTHITNLALCENESTDRVTRFARATKATMGLILTTNDDVTRFRQAAELAR